MSTLIIKPQNGPAIHTTNFVPMVLNTSGTSADWPDITNKPDGIISSSIQVQSWSVATASVALNAPTLPTGIVTSSAQIDFANISNKPAGIVTSSNQVAYSGLSGVPTGIVSSSTQITTVATASLANLVDFSNVSNKPSIVSASSQVSYTGLTNVPANIISSSAQFPTGVVSSSAQAATWTVATASYVPGIGAAADFNTLINKPVLFSSSVQIPQVATASLANAVSFANITNKPVLFSASAQIPNVATASLASAVAFTDVFNKPSLVSASAQVSYTGLANVPANIVSSSAQVPSVTSASVAQDLRPNFKLLTANATASVDDYFIVYNTSAGAFNVLLPFAGSVKPGHYMFFYGYGATGTNVITLVATGSDLILVGGSAGTSTSGSTRAFGTANFQKYIFSDGVSSWYYV